MEEEEFRIRNGKKLSIGYTTGSCASAAAAAAAQMLLTGTLVHETTIRLPSGEPVSFDIEEPTLYPDRAACAVRKDGGDDPDATHGLLVYATVSWEDGNGTVAVPENAVALGPLRDDTLADIPDSSLRLAAGEGVGVVTKPGLQCGVGEPAINPVPRRMIRASLDAVWKAFGGGDSVGNSAPRFLITISVPGGEEVAKKTFNPRLGIQGGISILGTTGIVEPMSEKALLDTIHVDVDRKYAENPEAILITPGNYGRTFLKEELGIDIDQSAQVSNYVGEALDYIKYKGFQKILFVGHAGKLIKLAAGVMNTHSSYADARMEVIAAHAACLGAKPTQLEEILNSLTTDEAFGILQGEDFFDALQDRIMDRILYHLNFRLKGVARIEVVLFTTSREQIWKSPGADELLAIWQES